MEVENHKEEVPFEYYLEKYQSLDPVETAQRLDILYDASTQKFQLRFMGFLYEVSYPEFSIKSLEKETADKEQREIYHVSGISYLWRVIQPTVYRKVH